jgi:hypothetical protein
VSAVLREEAWKRRSWVEVHASDVYTTSDIDLVVERAVIDPRYVCSMTASNGDALSWLMVHCVGLTAA